MSLRERIREQVSGFRVDYGLAILGLITAFVLFPLRYITSQFYIVTLPVVLAGACLLYLLSVPGMLEPSRAYRSGYDGGDLPRITDTVARLLPSVVLFLLGTMVLVAAVAEVRSIIFYDLTGIVGCLVLLQVLFTPDEEFHTGLLLGEILLVAFVVRFAGLYTTPGFIGIDIWSHVPAMADAIYTTHSLDGIADSKYYFSPLYHLLTTVSALLFGQSLRNGLYLSTGIVMALSPLFIYVTGSLFLPRRWAVLTTALYAFADHVVRWGLHIIPTSLGLFFFLGVIYFLVRILHTDITSRNLVMVVFFGLAVLFTHQISIFITLVLLGSGFVAAAVFRYGLVPVRNPRQQFQDNLVWSLFASITFLTGLTILVWSITPFQGSTFLLTMTTLFQERLLNQAAFLNLIGSSAEETVQNVPAVEPEASLINTVAKYVNHGGFLLLLFGGVLGSLSVFYRKRSNQTTYTLAFAALFMLIFVLGLPVFGIQLFIPGRWIAFLYAPLVLLTMIGFLHLRNNLSSRAIVAVLLLFTLVYPNVMAISSESTLENPAFPSQHVRYGYTESELTAVHTIGDIGGPTATETPLYTDQPYATVFTRTGNHFTRVLRLSNGQPVVNETIDTVVYRSYQTTGGAFVANDAGSAVLHKVAREQVCPIRTNHVYANGNVRMCIVPGEADPQ